MIAYVYENYKDKIEKGPLVSKIFIYINDEKKNKKNKKQNKILKKAMGFEKCNSSKILAEIFFVA